MNLLARPLLLLFISHLFSLLSYADTPAVTKTRSTAYVRILHAIAGAPAADFYLNDKKIAEKVTFKSLGDYREIESGKTIIKMTASGGLATILESSATFARDGYYTIAPFGTMDKAKLAVQNDSTAKNDEKKARIRVFHLAPGASELSFAFVPQFAGDEKVDVIKNLEYGADTTKLIVPGTMMVQVGVGDKIVYEMPDVNFAAGKRYALFAIGKLQMTGPQAFELLVHGMGREAEK